MPEILFQAWYSRFDVIICRIASEEEVPDNPWRVQKGALFGRLESFLNRIGDLSAAFQAAAQFQRLERIEVGSTKVGPSQEC